MVAYSGELSLPQDADLFYPDVPPLDALAFGWVRTAAARRNDPGPLLHGMPVLSLEQSLGRQLGAARADVASAIRLHPLWIKLGWNDILFKYRRSILGPFWSTLNTTITVLALGLIYSQLFNLAVAKLIPYACAGLIVWNFISSVLLESGSLFSGSESYIKQLRLPFSLYVLRFVFSKAIAFLHEFPVFLVLGFYFQIEPGLVAICAGPAFLLLAFNGALAGLTIGMASARFRDIPRIVASGIQILFLITPVIWMPELLGNKGYLADFNPFFHMIEMVRGPLLGHLPGLQTLAVALVITTLNFTVTTFLFLRYRARIAYWV